MRVQSQSPLFMCHKWCSPAYSAQIAVSQHMLLSSVCCLKSCHAPCTTFCKCATVLTQSTTSLCREYKQGFEQRQNSELASRLYKPFAPIAAISFPFFWAPSFGELGSPMWRKWGLQFKQSDIQTKCCVWHALDLTRGACMLTPSK